MVSNGRDGALDRAPVKEGSDIHNEILTFEFDEAMHNIYRNALSEENYNATRFLHEHRGLETARILLHAPKVSDGYTTLSLRDRLDLTVEALIHDNPKWHPLFTEEELAICKARLVAYEYLPKE
jgi:hypothetical protein